MTQGRRIALLLVALLGCQTVEAQASVICDKLRERLAATPVVTGNSREARRYSSAITKQNFEIRKARQDMQRLRCDGSVVVYDSDGRNACGELSGALRRMEENKRILTEKRNALQGGSDGGATRMRLLAALETNGCDAQIEEATRPDRPVEGPRLPRALTGTPEYGTTEFGAADTVPPGMSLPDGQFAQGPLRTMCVSTCDGSFFPISSNGSPINFQRDAQQCSQMCPGAATELFYHSLLTQESADMVSAVTGEPYRNLPQAFAYLSRTPGEKSACSCNLADYHRRVMAAQTPPEARKETYSAITEIRGPVAPRPISETTPPPPERVYDPQAEKVRRIGPAFLPSETSSIDLRNPATPGPQPIQQ